MADRSTPEPPGALPRLGRYEMIAGIASGGMGSVVLARLAGAGGFQRLFAIKMLHQRYGNDDEFMQMLLDEARISARFHHPNVVSIQEIVESPDHGYYLVMDYVEGFPLSDVIPQLTSLPWRTRARIVNRVMFDATMGLHAAHSLQDDHGVSLNVIHRDVSPQNILVSVDGVGRVTDFGIAKAAARITQTLVGAVKGKAAYMSPEQARGKPLDARTDLFAAGIVWWESLLGQRLFKGENEHETYKRLLAARIPLLREVTPEAPEALELVLARSLERDPAKRFASAREMGAALESAARASDLMGDTIEIGDWLKATFRKRLEERRSLVRKAASDTLVAGQLQMIQAPAALGPGSELARSVNKSIGSFSVTEREHTSVGDAVEDDEMDRLPTTHMDTKNAPEELKAAMAAFEASIAPRPSAPSHPGSRAWDPRVVAALSTTQPLERPAVASTPVAMVPARSLGRTLLLTVVVVVVAAAAVGLGFWFAARGAGSPSARGIDAASAVAHA